MPGNHHHRSGPLKQSNKRNKRNKSSKRSLTRQAGGKVDGIGGVSRQRAAYKSNLNVIHNKADRRHIQQQKRASKREELLRRKRGIGSTPSAVSGRPPRIVGIVSLGEVQDELEDQLQQLIVGQADNVISNNGNDAIVSSSIKTAKYEKHKKDGLLTVLTNSKTFRSQYDATMNGTDAAVFAALDLCRVCDVLVFVIDAHGSRSEDSIMGMDIGGTATNADDDGSKSHNTKATTTATSSSQDWDHLISDRGDKILSAVKSQGLPRVVTVLAKTESDPEIAFHDDDDDHMTTQSAKSLRRANLKRKTEIKKYISRFATTEFGVDNDKVMEVNLIDRNHDMMENNNGDDKTTTTVRDDGYTQRILAESLVRGLCTMSAAPSNWISNLPRPYMLPDTHRYDSDTRELHLTGYIRGLAPFDVHTLIHVPNIGTFACKSVQRAKNPLLVLGRKRRNADSDMGNNDDDDDVERIDSDPMQRENLDRFATPDALEGEQNLVGFDEADDDEFDEQAVAEKSNLTDSAKTFARPAGWSDYQSAWLDAVDEDAIDVDDFDHGELARELNQKSSASVATNAMDLDDANHISEEERRALIEQRRKEQREDHEFPDEVQVNEDEKARERFARYRSLKSFKKSYWDPKENLPDSYSSIFHFASFKTTQRSVMSEMRDLIKASDACNGNFWNGVSKNPGENNNTMMAEDSDEDDDILKGCVPSGSYVTLTLENVDNESYDNVAGNSVLTAVALLPHENKVSVLHMGLSNCSDSEVPVKSKDVLTFRCGWRTWTGRPVFSQNNLNCDKHKFERYLPPTGSFFAASVFGPVTYTPCPVLVFRNINGSKELVASGSMIGADADRIVVKRIILTGYPVRVHKRFASVKYMFYDPEDVKWFKPAGLTTKHGLNGKIEESVGEHGTMKCLFNAPIKQHDTVCLCLYKRIYPKFVEEDRRDGFDNHTLRTISQKTSLIVK